MPQVVFESQFKFSPDGHTVLTFEPNDEPVVVSERCAEIAIANRFARAFELEPTSHIAPVLVPDIQPATEAPQVVEPTDTEPAGEADPEQDTQEPTAGEPDIDPDPEPATESTTHTRSRKGAKGRP